MLRGLACAMTLVPLCLGSVVSEWAGSKVCSGCHMLIYRSYEQTDMGRSMSQASDSIQLSRVPERVTVPARVPGRVVDVYLQDGRLFQSESQRNPDGTELFRTTHQLDYAIGSGMNGTTYITHENGFLYQAPLSYFSKIGKWEWSPGYEKEDPGFSRPVLAGCVSCHTGLPQTDSHANGRFGTPPFVELAIGCENCHGPGKAHVLKQSQKRLASDGRDDSIVNPGRLPARLAENVCIRCHQAGDAPVLSPGKDYSDFRPGHWLAETEAIFKVPLKKGEESSSEVLEHYSGMILSKCFTASGGKLTCTTCHDPHSSPRPEQKASWYRGRCLQCHQETSCRLPLPERNREPAGDDCAACHMPKNELRRFAHSALTDHRITARPGEPYPELAYHQTTPDIPDLVYVNKPGEKSPAAVSDVVLLQAYGSLAARFPEYGQPYLKLLEKLRAAGSREPPVLAALGRYEMSQDGPDHDLKACNYFEQAIAGGETDPQIYQAWAEVLARSNRLSEAVDVLKRGIDQAPWDETLHKYLAWRLIKLRRYAEAKQVIASCVARFPQDDFMRNMLAQVSHFPE